MRQLTSSTGAVTYAKAYDPYGSVTSTAGASQTAYGYTGEFTSNDLVYLRARHYAPDMGRFLTRDTWSGNYNNPQSLNRWMYTGGNPVNRTDPNGQCWYPQQGGGVGIDYSDSSPLLCSWFITMFQNNGIVIPPNATPQNWLDNIPPNHQSIIAAYTTCVLQNPDLWLFIRFGTSPNWEYFESRYTGAEFKLIIGFGGGGSFNCDTMSEDCSLSGSLGLGENVTILNYKLALSVGVEADWDIYEGTLDVGGTADLGNCNLYLSLFRLSVSCSNPLDPYSYEMGFRRDKFEEYLVIVNSNQIRSLGYEKWARRNLNFKHQDSRIYHQILDKDQDQYKLVVRHLFTPNIMIFP